MQKQYFTYILTNADRTVLYTGVTNNLARRLIEHWTGSEGSFTTRYKVYYLLWFEPSRYVLNAIAREKEIKNLLREKKEALIGESNADWRFLNEDIIGRWPPAAEGVAAVKEYLRLNPSERER